MIPLDISLDQVYREAAAHATQSSGPCGGSGPQSIAAEKRGPVIGSIVRFLLVGSTPERARQVRQTLDEAKIA